MVSKLVRAFHNVKLTKYSRNIWQGIEPDNISLANFTRRYLTDIKEMYSLQPTEQQGSQRPTTQSAANAYNYGLCML